MFLVSCLDCLVVLHGIFCQIVYFSSLSFPPSFCPLRVYLLVIAVRQELFSPCRVALAASAFLRNSFGPLFFVSQDSYRCSTQLHRG